MDLEEIKNKAQEEVNLVQDQNTLENFRIKYLGRKSELSLFFDNLKNLNEGERRSQGKKANEVRHFLLELYQKKKEELEQKPKDFEFFDFTRPGQKIKKGHLHPLTLVTREIVAAFEKIGFAIVEGPEIETEYYNFDALRIPEDHPAREMWDTFWLKIDSSGLKTKNSKTSSKYLLRTHTSPLQIRYMETHQPPFKIIMPGKCFRFEATDSHHEIQFHQIEGLVVGENVSLANFKFIIEGVLQEIFHHKVVLRFRPSYFPFVTPGLEIDIKIKNKPKSPWLEVMGAGMVHPDLFNFVGYEKKRWQGFAFGLGVERITMIKYGIDDIRLFFSSDERFLKQF